MISLQALRRWLGWPILPVDVMERTRQFVADGGLFEDVQGVTPVKIYKPFATPRELYAPVTYSLWPYTVHVQESIWIEAVAEYELDNGQRFMLARGHLMPKGAPTCLLMECVYEST